MAITPADITIPQQTIDDLAEAFDAKVGKSIPPGVAKLIRNDEPEVENLYRVSPRPWKRWTPAARRLFNDMYELGADQSFFKHPDAQPVDCRNWITLRWNFAWMAADMLSRQTNGMPKPAKP